MRGPFSFHTLVAQEGAVSNEATSIFRNSRQRTTQTAQTITDTKRMRKYAKLLPEKKDIVPQTEADAFM